MISTKGRYALRLVADIAAQGGQKSVPLRDVAERQELSQKYLEMISTLLCRGGLLVSHRGKSGGYGLAREASRISVADVLRAAEGSISPVSCSEMGHGGCSRAQSCLTLPVWRNLDRLIEDYLSGITIDDVLSGNLEDVGQFMNKKEVQ